MDIEKLKKAIIYVDRIAKGHNPVNDVLMPNDAILNNANVVRCMYYVKDILEEVYRKNSKKKPFTYEILSLYKYESDKTVTKVFKQINDLIDDKEVSKVKCTNFMKWLKKNEYLIREETFGYDNPISIVTDKGRKLGLYNEVRVLSSGAKYMAVMFNKKAQEFIKDNLESIEKEMEENN